jgi:phospholipid-binding lipoprotein MlaA
MRVVLPLVLCLTLLVLSFAPLLAADDFVRPAAAAQTGGDDFDAEFDDDFDDDFDDESEAQPRPLIADPLEPWNRGVFLVNDKLYFYLFKPVARGYRVVPRPVRTSIGNFFSNLSTPVRAVNALLQLKVRDVGTELGRLAVNSTIGWGGLFDPAGYSLRWKKKSEDFGQTLGFYGVKSGWYLVLPIFGPSSVRDGAGLVVDQFLDPLLYADIKVREYYSLRALERVNALSLDADSYEKFKRDALDPYLFIRAAYAQHRLANIRK